MISVRAVAMRAALIPALLAMAGCTAFAHPIVTPTPGSFDTRLVGTWVGTTSSEADDEAGLPLRVEVRRDGRAVLSSPDPDSPNERMTWRLSMARVDGLDLVNAFMRDEGKTIWHPLRYEIAQDELRVFLLDDEVWFDAVKSGALPGTASRGAEGPSTWVAASSDALAAFLMVHRETAFHAEAVVLRRIR